MAFVSPACFSFKSSQFTSTSSRPLSRRTFTSRRAPFRISVRCAAAPETSEKAAAVPFELRGFSLANVGLIAGFGITAVSFSSYFNSAGTASATSLGFVYGIPVLLIGCALKYAELPPIPVSTTPGATAARETKATDTQKQIFKDITRHRYGDEAHLQPALSSLGLIPRGEACPVLLEASESIVDDGYCLELVFESLLTPYREWENKKEKYERFFGPNVKVNVEKKDAAKRLVSIAIISVAE